MPSPFLRLKSRYLLLWLVVSSATGALIASPPTLPASAPEPLRQGMLGWITYLVLVAATALQAWRAGLRPARVLGRPVSGADLRRLSILAVPLVGSALVCAYGVFAPLSLVWPDVVHFWLIEDNSIPYDAGPPYPLVANLVAITAVIIAAPFSEEWLFRGLLLRRWSVKWGTTSGVIGTSLVFGVLHGDILGAFLFGVAMCALYERYHSLWPPIVVHAATNALVMLIAMFGEHTGTFEQPRTVEQFRDAWWMLIVGVLMAAPWLGRVRRTWTPIAGWRFEAGLSTSLGAGPSTSLGAGPSTGRADPV